MKINVLMIQADKTSHDGTTCSYQQILVPVVTDGRPAATHPPEGRLTLALTYSHTEQ